MPREFSRSVENDGLAEAKSFSQQIVDQDPRDTPDPIIYKDKYGKTVLTFPKVGFHQSGARMFDVKYSHNGNPLRSLSPLLGYDFFFYWTNGCRFSVGSADGTPAVFIDHNLLQEGREYLAALLHEIGHSHQYLVDADLWQILRKDATKQTLKTLWKRYPKFQPHISDLVALRNYCLGDNNGIQTIIHRPHEGVNTKGLNWEFLQIASEIQELTQQKAPIGPTHLVKPFFGRLIEYQWPGVYMVLDAMGEEFAWRSAWTLQEKEKIECGLHTDKDRINAMIDPLLSYDNHYGTKAYTRWLREARV